MGYFADLTPYRYPLFAAQWSEKLLAVGWLDAKFPYPKGNVEELVLDRLLDLCERPVNVTRGLHQCPFCGQRGILVIRGERRLILGNAEIRVHGALGKTYTAPTLIYHYIKDHEYRPPYEFIEAMGVS